MDEVQDVDRSQLRLALLLAAPANRIFLVGDDDQSIYGWRLADVRRVLELARTLPGLRRVDLVTNYRCPEPVVTRAVRLVERNRERFAKVVSARPNATGSLILAPDDADEVGRVGRILEGWPDDGGSRAFLARTNRELLPALAVALERRLPFRADRVATPLDDPRLDALLAEAAATDPCLPLLVRLASLRAFGGTTEPESAVDTTSDDAPFTRAELVAALLAWAVPYPDLEAFTAAVLERRDLLATLRSDDARLGLATAHCDEGPRVRPRGGPRDGGRPLPERPVDRRRGGPGAGPRGGAPARLRGVDPGAADTDPELRSGGRVAVPRRGVRPRRAAGPGGAAMTLWVLSPHRRGRP